MEANEAPEKLYLDATSKCGDTVFTIRNNDKDIEYTRTDAFIKKACEWIKYNNENGGCLFDGWEDNFKKYMEE